MRVYDSEATTTTAAASTPNNNNNNCGWWWAKAKTKTSSTLSNLCHLIDDWNFDSSCSWIESRHFHGILVKCFGTKSGTFSRNSNLQQMVECIKFAKFLCERVFVWMCEFGSFIWSRWRTDVFIWARCVSTALIIYNHTDKFMCCFTWKCVQFWFIANWILVL